MSFDLEEKPEWPDIIGSGGSQAPKWYAPWPPPTEPIKVPPAPFHVLSSDDFHKGVAYGLRLAAGRISAVVGETASAPPPCHLSGPEAFELVRNEVDLIREDAKCFG